ncbi:MAG TPA: hypothetical protein VF209_00770, partial [Patescibacteria group bacterium]
INATPKHQSFFSHLFFTSHTPHPPLIDCQIIFKSITRPRGYLQIEKDVIATEDTFYISDTQQHLAEISWQKLEGNQLVFIVDPDFDLYYFYTFILEPLLIIKASHLDILFVHASAVSQAGKTWLFPAWRNTGKTHSMLTLTQQGYAFTGDDYCVVRGKTVYLYPKKVNLFSYNFSQFPQIFASLDVMTRWRLKIILAGKILLRQLSSRLGHPFSKILYRLSELAEVATNVTLSPEAAGIPVASQGQLHQLVLLQKTTKHRGRTKLTEDELAEKLWQVIQYELKDFFETYHKYQYLFPQQRVAEIESFEQTYRQLVKKLLIKPQLQYFSEKEPLSL